MAVRKETLEQALLRTKGIHDVLDYFPRKYHSFPKIVSPSGERIGQTCLFAGFLQRAVRYPDKLSLRVKIPKTDGFADLMFVTLFHRQWEFASYLKLEGKTVYIAGKLGCFLTDSNAQFFSISSPIMVTGKMEEILGVTPVYRNIRGFQQKGIRESIRKELGKQKSEIIPESLLKKRGLCGRVLAYQWIHAPENLAQARCGLQYVVYEDLLYFGIRLEMEAREKTDVSPFIISKSPLPQLPYALTKDQKGAIEWITDTLAEGKRADVLLQGDVGCGKSVVAFAAMDAVAQNGYQSVLLAPTVVLARQHFRNFTSLFSNEAVLLTSGMRAAEKREALQKIESGEAKVIIGTHSVLSDTITYKQLALAIIDEEQRFGVKQRDALLMRASQGVHIISMTATPIPRSLAQTLYGARTKLLEIKTMPPGRIPVKTILSDESGVTEIIKRAVADGSRVFVVCPAIDDGDKKSVKEAAAWIKESTGCKVGVLTGRQKKGEAEEILDAFVEGKTPILCATTVIEVGVDVPDAALMIILDADMFGLSQLHQLRGRVGRGKRPGTCILVSEKPCKRLEILTKTTDGFKIAEADASLRGFGNLFGQEQSGRHWMITEAAAFPKTFATAREDARELLEKGLEQPVLEAFSMQGDIQRVGSIRIVGEE